MAAALQLCTPHRIEQPVGRDHLIGVQQQERQQRTLPGAAQRQHPVAVADLERAQNRELHLHHILPPKLGR